MNPAVISAGKQRWFGFSFQASNTNMINKKQNYIAQMKKMRGTIYELS